MNTSETMTLVALSASRAPSPTLSPIPQALSDADLIYDTFASIGAAAFDSRHSVCVSDPTVADLRSLVTLAADTLSSNALLIIYYSGHAILEGVRLYLLFGNISDGSRGRVSITEVGEWLAGCKGEILFILDCCHSGAALTLANITDPLHIGRISVLASGEPHSRSGLGSKYSIFTEAFCNAVTLLQEQRQALSLVRLVSVIKEQSHLECALHLRQDIADLLMPTSSSSIRPAKGFAADFVRLSTKSPMRIREMLWYSLMSAPVDSRAEILNAYLDFFKKHEPSWVVRRAIGTVLHSCRRWPNLFSTVVKKLLMSPSWMDQCIGLIGCRDALGQGELRQQATNILLGDTSMDAVWLAHLYLRDNRAIALKQALGTSLSKTSWGITDILTRWITDDSDLDATVDEVIAQCSNQELARAVGTHLKCMGITNAQIGNLPVDEDVAQSNLIQILYQTKRRGKTSDPILKWLVSMLYGNWRDQVQIDVLEWIRNISVSAGREQLKICSKAPAVEVRMAVFEAFARNTVESEAYKDSLLWGLSDPHPWVRRIALGVFNSEKSIAAEALLNTADMACYPGVLDLYLDAFRYQAESDIYKMSAALTGAETQALAWACSQEAKAV